ncbi:MAG TPA: phytanoyl-CoA dioxygenase family protein [Candidatus Angelobacter sp.]|nr:phytanoyl-CoA dioxygenase family protein [Candidatus Angelobacter sp.]
MHFQISTLIEKQGFAILPNIVTEAEIASLLAEIPVAAPQRGRAGMRHTLGIAAVSTLAHDHKLPLIARDVLGPTAFPFRATLFDKSPQANWLIAWHQDTALPLQEKITAPGWGPWSIKQGMIYAHAPASALNQVLALRIHLDASTEQNGPLRVLPGTHVMGVLSDEEVSQLAEQRPAVSCPVPQGGVLAMKPLLIHASSKSTIAMNRRVLHIEYAAHEILGDGLQLAAG